MQYSNEVLVLNTRMCFKVDESWDNINKNNIANLVVYANDNYEALHHRLSNNQNERSYNSVYYRIFRIKHVISDYIIEGYGKETAPHRFILEHKATREIYVARSQDILFQD